MKVSEAVTSGSNLKLTSQFIFCPYCLSMDTYDGCPHNCLYCFARVQYRKNKNMLAKGGMDKFGTSKPRDIRPVIKLINGHRSSAKQMKLINWLTDHRQPIHIGGMADPFPVGVESDLGVSRLLLENCGDYPIMWSTKNPPVEYADLFARGNHIQQVSIISTSDMQRKIEPGVPHALERIAKARELSKACKKTIIRFQPYIPYINTLDDVKRLCDAVADFADGMTIEFLKLAPGDDWRELRQVLKFDIATKMRKTMESEGGDAVFPSLYRFKKLVEIRDIVHEHGMEFYCAENQFRDMGDGPACCGVRYDDKATEADKLFKSQMTWTTGFALFKAKEMAEKGNSNPLDLFSFIDNNMPKEVAEMSGGVLGKNAASRKRHIEVRAMTMEQLLKMYMVTRHQYSPTIFYRGLKVVDKNESNKVIFKPYEDDLKDKSGFR